MEKYPGMKVRWIGETDFLVLTHGKIYTVLSIEKDWYRVIDDSGEDYLYPPQLFEIVEEQKANLVSMKRLSPYILVMMGRTVSGWLTNWDRETPIKNNRFTQ